MSVFEQAAPLWTVCSGVVGGCALWLAGCVRLAGGVCANVRQGVPSGPALRRTGRAIDVDIAGGGVLRSGCIGRNSARLLYEAHRRTLDAADGIKPTQLCVHRAEMTAANEAELSKLEGESKTYYAVDSGDSRLLKDCPAAEEVKLKVGAQVVLLRNLYTDMGLANGTLGVVTRFVLTKAGQEVPLVRCCCVSCPVI